MSSEGGYRASHTHPDKGAAYDKAYRDEPWRRFLWTREQAALLRILDKYFKGRDINLLDFACGTGRVTRFLEERVTKSVGVDVSSSMLREARGKLKRTELIQADLTTEDVLPGRKFNLITSLRFFLNAEPILRSETMKKLSTLMSDDGLLVFNNHQNRSSFYFSLARMLQSKDRAPHTMSIAEMDNLTREAGLEIVELYPIGCFRLPKIMMPHSFNRALEGMARLVRWPTRFWESLIAVCRSRS